MPILIQKRCIFALAIVPYNKLSNFMKLRNFVLNCSSRQFVLLLDALSNYCSVLEDSLLYLDLDVKDSSVLKDVQDLQDKLNSLL